MTARAALAVALAAGAAACGGDDQSFEHLYRAESAEIDAIGRDIGMALRGARDESNPRLATQFKILADRAQTSVDDLEDLDPPANLTDKRAALVKALRTGTADLRAIAAATRADDPRRARRATEKLVADSRAIRNARGHLDHLTEKR